MYPPRRRPAPMFVDAVLASLAEPQYGVFTDAQSRSAGVSAQALWRRVERGRVFRVHRGVYALGHCSVSVEGRWMAAVLAAGHDAALARHSAAALWGVTRLPARSIDVIVPRRHRPILGVDLRQTRSLPSDEVRVHRGVPVTSFARTLVDLADELEATVLANLMHEAAFRRRLNLRELRRVAGRHRNRIGHARLQRAVEMHVTGSSGTHSALEDRYLAAHRRVSAREPRINERVRVSDGAIRVDFHWPDERICVEVDGSGHRRPRTRREDADRDRRLCAAGYTVIRVTADQLEHRAGEVAALLARGTGEPSHVDHA